MNRRKFMKSLFGALPAVAAPSLAVSAYAVHSSSQTQEWMQDVVLTKDNAVFQNCNFNLPKGLHLYGNGQQVLSCNFTGFSDTAMYVHPPEPQKDFVDFKIREG